MVELPAKYGGEPVRTKPLPSISDASGRWLGDEELALLTKVIRSGRLNRVYGGFVREFERRFAELMGVKHAIASTSGTAAIHVALGACDIGPGDEVITTPITDMGTIIPILFQNAIPVFADIDPETFNLNPEDVRHRISDKTRAIIVVHLFGMPAEMDVIMEIAESHDLYVIEDCAQAYLAEYKGRFVGTIGHLGAFSLQQSKHITTGDGGITITNDEDLAWRAKLFADKGWDREVGRCHLFLGNNYRMTELQGAVALAQLDKLKWVVKQRRELADLLTKKLMQIEGVHPPKVPSYCKHSYWQYPVRIEVEALGITIGEFSEALRAEGIPNSPGYVPPVYLQPVLAERKIYRDRRCPLECPLYGKRMRYESGLCPNAERMMSNVIVIPWNEFYTSEDVEDIARAFEKLMAYYTARRQ